MYSIDAQMVVLTVLAGGPRHGYAINAEIETLTGRRLGPGSLYGAITRLEARGLIEPADGDADGQERQRTMRITEAGRASLRSELEQLSRVTRAGLHALGLGPA